MNEFTSNTELEGLLRLCRSFVRSENKNPSDVIKVVSAAAG